MAAVSFFIYEKFDISDVSVGQIALIKGLLSEQNYNKMIKGVGLFIYIQY